LPKKCQQVFTFFNAVDRNFNLCKLSLTTASEKVSLHLKIQKYKIFQTYRSLSNTQVLRKKCQQVFTFFNTVDRNFNLCKLSLTTTSEKVSLHLKIQNYKIFQTYRSLSNTQVLPKKCQQVFTFFNTVDRNFNLCKLSLTTASEKVSLHLKI